MRTVSAAKSSESEMRRNMKGLKGRRLGTVLAVLALSILSASDVRAEGIAAGMAVTGTEVQDRRAETEGAKETSGDSLSNVVASNPPTQEKSEEGKDAEADGSRETGADETVEKEIQKKWKKIDGFWYLFGDGEKWTGWQQVKSSWYYLNEKGIMQSGWQKIDGSWYYFGGAEDGARKSGWQKTGGKWYYLDKYGVMQTGWQQIRGSWYYLNGSGAMQTGWIKLGGSWYYLDGSGAMKFGWQKLGGVWYYLGGRSDGAMKTGWQQIDKKWYYFYQSGSMAANTYIGSYWVNGSGEWIEGAGPVLTLKGTAKLTFYDGSQEANGGCGGRNAYGVNGGNLALGQVSCSRSYLPAHTILYITTANATGEGSYANGKYFYVADTGVCGAHVDICVPGERLLQRNPELGHAPYGAGTGQVYIVKYNATWEEYKANFFTKCNW